MHKTISIAAMLLACASVSAQEAAPTASADAAPLSRLRLFGQNGAMVSLYQDSSCIKGMFSGGEEKVSGGMASAFGSLIGSVENTSLGMPDTPTTLNLAKKDGIFSKAYFKEYALPAGKPSSLRLHFQDVSSFYVANGIRYESRAPSCGGQITFTPHAGEDYEAAFEWEGKQCSVTIKQVIVKEGQTELVPVPVALAPSC
ncbi:hypothetical protein [Janthinobacterium agaricidamnosum]|uniref:Putative secreted protein n=1 Tax=Janthinobacterium agaricidamnosum NBRC 102515 = DSM 9628 TaxID=1349767 RepID=W0UZP0_9BURK|nr:hypothetical protein [Janthinobacterium agaricidamnosum]CDG80845.1 putative secreted protein [Janthinobacterium agaricidamnosum NBRC 102515 = DSM 9628]